MSRVDFNSIYSSMQPMIHNIATVLWFVFVWSVCLPVNVLCVGNNI